MTMTKSLRWVMCLSLTILLSTVVLANPNDGDDGVDRPGGDLPGMPIDLPATGLPRDCATLCMANQECVAWVYVLGKNNTQLTPKALKYVHPALLRRFGIAPPQCYLKGQLNPQAYAPFHVSGVKMTATQGLVPLTFIELPLGAITPQGWLKGQLQEQAAGLSGYLAEFWPTVMSSVWIGGNQDNDLIERVPYWLNGLVGLAYLLEDPRLLDQAGYYIDYILENQGLDGWLGPDIMPTNNTWNREPWARYMLLHALRQYVEVSGNTRALDQIFIFLKRLHVDMLTTYPLNGWGEEWSTSRFQDFVVTLQWLYDNHPSGQEQFLWDVMELAEQQGYDWGSYFAGPYFPNDTVTSNFSYWTHGVNLGMSLKEGAIRYRRTHNQSHEDSTYQRIDILYQYHGQASGIFTCDEHLGGLMPSHGTELCAVVETMYSFEMLFGVFGNMSLAEQAEMITFNALPATFAKEMWAHQYLQQSNQINAKELDDGHVWVTDGPNSTLFGLEPNYGCCTANFNQGWPKFVSHLFYKTGDGNGLVAAMYAPCSVDTTLSNGTNNVTISVITDYPFNELINMEVNASLPFNLSLRIPSWAEGATVALNGTAQSGVNAGELFSMMCPGGYSEVEIYFPMKCRIQRRYNNSVSVYNGPLLFALYIENNFTELAHYAFESSDYELDPLSPWNYGLIVDDDAPDSSFKVMRLPVDAHPFSPEGAPVVLTALGRQIDWDINLGAATAPPLSPVESSAPIEAITFLPFGSTNLRIAEIPTVLD